MVLANCTRCGKVFNQITRVICNDCFNQEEEDLKRVQHYLRDDPKANKTIEGVAEAYDLEESMIRKWILEKRLVMKSTSPDDVQKCESCGAPIMGGRLCRECQGKLTSGSSSGPAIPKEGTPKKESRRDLLSGGDSTIIKHKR